MKFPVIPGCKPAKVYLALAVIAFVYCVVKGRPISSTMLMTKGVFIAAWTAFLVFVCKSRLPQGARPLTWVLVFLPFLYMWWTTGMMEGMESKSCATCKSTHKSCKEACAKAGGNTDKCNKKCKDSYLKCYGSSCSS
jgi:hypothetical protein